MAEYIAKATINSGGKAFANFINTLIQEANAADRAEAAERGLGQQLAENAKAAQEYARAGQAATAASDGIAEAAEKSTRAVRQQSEEYKKYKELLRGAGLISGAGKGLGQFKDINREVNKGAMSAAEGFEAAMKRIKESAEQVKQPLAEVKQEFEQLVIDGFCGSGGGGGGGSGDGAAAMENAADEMKGAFSRLLELQRLISSNENKLAGLGLGKNGDAAQIGVLHEEIRKLTQEYGALFEAARSSLSDEQIERLIQKENDLGIAVRTTTAAMADKVAAQEAAEAQRLQAEEDAYWRQQEAEEAARVAQREREVAAALKEHQAEEAALERATERRLEQTGKAQADAYYQSLAAEEAARQQIIADEAEAQRQADEYLAQQEAEAAAAEHVNSALQNQIDAMLGIGRETKSAAESAFVLVNAAKNQEEALRAEEQAAKDAAEAKKKKAQDDKAALAEQHKGEQQLQRSIALEQQMREAHYAGAKEVADLRNEYKTTSMTADEFRNRLDGLNTSFKEQQSSVNPLLSTLGKWGNTLQNSLSRYIPFLNAAATINMAIRGLRDAIKTTIEFDDVLTQMQIVTRESDETIEAFGKNMFNTAKQIGASTTELIDSATVFARLGYSLDESQTLAKYTGMLQNVGDIEVSAAQDAITAIFKAFNDVDIGQIESVMDRMVTVGKRLPNAMVTWCLVIGYIGQRSFGVCSETEERLCAA